MINTYKNINEKQEERLRKFINKNLKFDENEKIKGTIKYNYESEEFDVSPSIKLTGHINKNDMKLLKHEFIPSNSVSNISIETRINYNVLSCVIEWTKDNGDIDKYEIDRLRLKCNHLNTFPFSNGDPISMEYIKCAIEEFISSVIKNNNNVKPQFVYFENNELIIHTQTEDIKKGLMSEEYLKYRVIVDEINVDPHSSISLMFFPDNSNTAYSVIIAATEYDENRKNIKSESETFLVDMI